MCGMVSYVLKTFTPVGKYQWETYRYLIFLNLRLASSTTFTRPFKQVLFLAIHATTMESCLFYCYFTVYYTFKIQFCLFFGIFAENVCLLLAWCILLKPIINSSMEKVTASLGWKELRKNQAWFLQVQPLWHTPLEYFLSGQGPFKVAEHSFSARFYWCKLARAQGFQKNKHAVNRVIILFTQNPHYLCYFSL